MKHPELMAEWVRSNIAAHKAHRTATKKFKTLIDTLTQDGMSDQSIATQLGISKLNIKAYRRIKLLPDTLSTTHGFKSFTHGDNMFDDRERNAILLSELNQALEQFTEGTTSLDIEDDTDDIKPNYQIESYRYTLGLRAQDEHLHLTKGYSLQWLIDYYALWRQHFVYSRLNMDDLLTESDKTRLGHETMQWSIIFHQAIESIDAVYTNEVTIKNAYADSIDTDQTQLMGLFKTIDQAVAIHEKYPYTPLNGQVTNIKKLKAKLMKRVG